MAKDTEKKQGFVEHITPRDVDFSQWYTDVILKSELVDYAPVRGCMVIRPYGFAIWERIKEQLTKYDLLAEDWGGDTIVCPISAKTGEGIPALLSAVDKKLDKGTKRVVIHLPYDKTGLLDGLYREAKVENVAYGETVDVTAVCTPRIMGQLKDYIEGWVEPKEDWE